MSRFKIIDSHAHIFPQKIAEKAVKSIGEFYDLPMRHGGTSEELIKSGSEINVEKYLVFSTATTEHQVKSINEFIYDACSKHKAFIGLGTLHPNMENYKEEIGRIIEMGLKGVKLHPDFQNFCIDDPKVMPIYKALEENKLILLSHVGDKRNNLSGPHRLARVAKAFPKLKIIAPHFGGWTQWEEAAETLQLPNVYFDTSSALYALDRERVLEMFRLLDSSKFFFGTDFPMWDHKEELECFLALGLSEKVTEDILYNNFMNLFEA